MHVVAIIQARIGSTRLHGKIMKDLMGKSVLEHDIERLRLSEEIDEIVIATTIQPQDDVIEAESERLGIYCFRGSEQDVLSRYYFAAVEKNAEIVIRLTSDCPLIDPKIIDQMVKFFKNHHYELVTNAGALKYRTYPRGLDAEVMSFSVLESAHINANEPHQREHVTPYIYETNSNIFYYQGAINHSDLRWTLDTEDDWKFITAVYNQLYHGVHNFFYDDILDLMQQKPELVKINDWVEQAYVQKDKDPGIYLRRAEISDLDTVYTWINDEEVRRQSFNSETIKYEDHVQWYKDQLNNPSVYYYIAQDTEGAVGQIRVKCDDEVCTISYLVSGLFRGKGYGRKILNLLEGALTHEFNKITLVGEVKETNMPSIKAFLGNGYEQSKNGDKIVFRKQL